MAISFQINRSSIRETQFVDPGHRDLAPGEVRFDIDFVALTSNNVTYAVAGDLLDYWGFFPVGLPWGHVPAMGYGTVIESANGGVEEEIVVHAVEAYRGSLAELLRLVARTSGRSGELLGENAAVRLVLPFVNE